MKNIALFPLILFFLFTGACSPIYKTKYRFSAPQSDTGKYCAQSCLSTLESCGSSCDNEQQSCKKQEDQEEELSYLRYVEQQTLKGEPIEKNRSDFRSYVTSCRVEQCKKDCADRHRICHVNCGGDIKEQRICTRFCD